MPIGGAPAATTTVTSDTALRTGPGEVYWIIVSSGGTGGAFQLNDSTDDSGTDLLDATVQASTGPWFLGSFDPPIQFKTGIYAEAQRQRLIEQAPGLSEQKEREIAALVAEGKLPGKGKGRRLRVQMGAFDDLLWHRAGILPENPLT